MAAPSKKNNYGASRSVHDIIDAVECNNYDKLEAALAEDPTCISAIHPATGMTVLHIAAGNGNANMVDHLLLKAGINIRSKDYFGRDPLDLAISIGHRSIIEAISRRMYPKSFENSEGVRGGMRSGLLPKFEL